MSRSAQFFLLSFVLALLAGAPAVSSAKQSSDAFLAGAWRDTVVQMRTANVNKYGSGGVSNPIENLQLRLTQEDYADDRKASLRAKPRGIREYRLLRQLHEQTSLVEDLSLKSDLGKALQSRYKALVDYRFAIEMRKTSGQILKAAQRLLSIVATSARSNVSNIKDVLRAREVVVDTQLKVAEADAAVSAAIERAKYLEASVKLDQLSFSDWPKVTDLLGILGPGKNISKTESVPFKLAREQAKRSQNAVDFETARESRILDYVEFFVSQDGLERRVGVEVAFNFPGFSGFDFANREKARQVIKYEIEAKEVEAEQVVELSEMREELIKNVEIFKMATSVEDNAIENRIKQLARNQDPLLSVSIERDALKKQLIAIEAARDAFRAYADYLGASGMLADRSTTNFLSRDLSEIRGETRR